VSIFSRSKRKVTPGEYVSQKSGETLAALQKKKTVFMYLSTLFFVTAIFVPLGEIPNAAKSAAFLYFGLVAYVVGIASAVAVPFLGRKKHKLRGTVTAEEAPRFGFKRSTYLTYELFTWWHAVMLGIQTALAVLDFSVYTALFCASMALSFAFAVVSRQILWSANKDMIFHPAAPAPEEEFYKVP
jgi:DMSO reductase anchor subunit